jgi:hypothetical protein
MGNYSVYRVVLGGALGICMTSFCLLAGARNGGQAPIKVEKPALLPVLADMPPGYVYWTYGGTETSDHAGNEATLTRWRGDTETPGGRPSAQNRILEFVSVKVYVADTPSNAWAGIVPGIGGPHSQVAPVLGSYSGKKIGDRCMRGGSARQPLTSASLWVLRGNVAYTLDINGPPNARDYVAIVETLATTLVDRCNAAMALAAAPAKSAPVGGRTLNSRIVNSHRLVLGHEYANAVGAVWSTDIPGGKASLTLGGRVLTFNIGRKEAILEGKTISLPFPALRAGREMVWCPLAVSERIRNLPVHSAS